MPLRQHASKMRPGNSQVSEKPDSIVLVEGAKSLDLSGRRFASSLRTCPGGYLSAPRARPEREQTSFVSVGAFEHQPFWAEARGFGSDLARAWLDAAPQGLTGCCGLAAAESYGFGPRKASHLAYPVASKRTGAAQCVLVPSLATTGTKEATGGAYWC